MVGCCLYVFTVFEGNLQVSQDTHLYYGLSFFSPSEKALVISVRTSELSVYCRLSA